MTAIFDIINKYILSYVMRFIMAICNNNFAVTIVIFTIFINALLIPLSIKSQKTSVQQIKIKPKLDELKKKYGDDRQKFAAAQQKLYQDEQVSMSGGCLPMIIRLVFLMSIYYLITKPLSYLTNIGAETVNGVINGLKNLGYIANTTYSPELKVFEFIKNPENIAAISDETLKAGVLEVQKQTAGMNFSLFGIDLTATPQFSFNFSEANILWVIPIIAFLAAFVAGLISTKLQKSINPDAPNMAAMNLIMPFFSMYIAFKAPCGLGFYWACSSLISGLVQAAVQYFYSPYKMIANERAKNLIKVNETESKKL
ncbi:MAG: membrane protein insertase YidC [Clostridia bacterium]|nr:membrane protein insertase YidC [Clostridia bacterium]